MPQPLITPLPTPPSIGNPATFASLASAFVAAQAGVFQPELNALITYINARTFKEIIQERCTLGGTANAITLTTGAGISGTIPTGLRVRFRATSTNSGSVTIALDGGSPIACRTPTGIALPANYIRTNVETEAYYDGVNWITSRAMERGNNGDGYYTRDETGIQMCWHRLNSSSGADVTWTFPQPFVNATDYSPGISCHTATPVVRSPEFESTSIAAASIAFRITDSAGNRIAILGYLTCIGRWY